MRSLKIYLTLIPILLFGSWQAQTEDEALFLRRIADFWEEGEYLVAKAQIEEFLSYYPSSVFGDTLREALGDLLLREKNYTEALNRYTQIQVPDVKKHSFLNRMQCLYHLGWYATLADECEQILNPDNDLDPHQKLQSTYLLAIALYQQCLNSAKQPDTLTHLAKRAEPYFQSLFESELSSEVAESFAHLCCILKDYPKAAKIFLDQSKLNPEAEEELLFQAALIQAEYDKDLAIETFTQIAKNGKSKAKEASYNCLILSFDAGYHDQLVSQKEEFLKKIPEERAGLAHLFLGRSFLALKQYPTAVSELKTYLEMTDESPSEMQRGALLSLLEAAFHTEDENAFGLALKQMHLHFPQDPEWPRIHFSHAQILKKIGALDAARQVLEKLLVDFPNTTQKQEIFFEQIQLEYTAKKWENCYKYASQYLKDFELKNDLTAYVWRYLVSSLMELGEKEKLVEQLQALVKDESLFTETERADWQFLLAKNYFELGNHSQAADLLESLLENHHLFPQSANAKLLLAYCYRDGKKDLERFCTLAEEAISKEANLIEKGPLHAALFNAYLQKGETDGTAFEKAEEHLYLAFQANAPIESENLLWLADRLGDRYPEKSAAVLDFLIQSSDENLAFAEPLISKRAKIHFFLKENEVAIGMLEKLMDQYKDESIEWHYKEENKLLLAQNLSSIGQSERAISLLDEILLSVPTLRSETAAAACLQRARVRVSDWRSKKGNENDPEIQKALVEFKNLTLQKMLAHEPIHLEAALDYIALKVELEPQQNRTAKELSLLKKTKTDFESANDLLSQDYHESLSRLPQKRPIYEGYLRLMEAQILCKEAELLGGDSQNKLQAKAKELLLQIIDACAHTTLVERSRVQLEKIDAAHVAKTHFKK